LASTAASNDFKVLLVRPGDIRDQLLRSFAGPTIGDERSVRLHQRRCGDRLRVRSNVHSPSPVVARTTTVAGAVGESIPGGEGQFQNDRSAAATPRGSTIGDDQDTSHAGSATR
jgi:hypothetical protein